MLKPAKGIIEPETILSWHEASPTLYWKDLYLRRRFDLIPPIPVILAPEDLRDVCTYVNYNGHHRKVSAMEVHVSPECYILSSDGDMRYLTEVQDGYEELIDGLGDNFDMHHSYICDMARYHQILKEVGQGQKPKQRNISNVTLRSVVRNFFK